MSKLVIVAAMLLVGCATPSLPPDLPTSPASPEARESRRTPLSSALRPNATDHAIVARLRETKSGAHPPEERPAANGDMSGMSGMQHGNMPMQMPAATPQAQPSAASFYYTCVMHPEIHQDHPGQCPKCGMTLVKKEGATPK